MALQDDLRDIIDKMEGNGSKWLLVAVGVILLLRLKLILFACALPVMAYWHFSNQPEESSAGEGEPVEEDDRGPDHSRSEPWPPGDDEDDDMGFAPPQPRASPGIDRDDKDEVDPYDSSFWGGDDLPPKRSAAAPWRGKKDGADLDMGLDDGDLGLGGPPAALASPSRPPPKAPLDGDDDFLKDLRRPSTGLSAGLKPPGGEDDPLADMLSGLGSGPLADPPISGGGFGGGSFGLGGGGGGADDGMDFGFLGSRLDDDNMDFLGGGRPKGKGKKGKGEKGDFKGKDPNAPREANPKQVFVANVGDMEEDEIREFFEEVGEVDRLKVLRQEDGSSKGVCFVTFRTEDQAQDALKLHGRQMDGGRNLVVRLAHGGNKGKEGDKGFSKGDRPPRDNFGDRPPRRDDIGPMDLGGSERFGAAFGFGRDREDGRGFGDRGGKGKGGRGKGRNERGEMDEILEEALADGDGPLRPGDFDFAARRFLSELRQRDQKEGTARLQEALDMVLKFTSSKDRSSVRKWPAYVFTLLQKFDQDLWNELRERDAVRRAEKGAEKGGFSRGRPPDDD